MEKRLSDLEPEQKAVITRITGSRGCSKEDIGHGTARAYPHETLREESGG